MSDNVKVFPLSESKTLEDTTPREALVEALRMIDTGEWEPTGMLVVMVQEGREGNDSWWHTGYVAGGKSLATFSRMVAWVEVFKHKLLRSMFGEGD